MEIARHGNFHAPRYDIQCKVHVLLHSMVVKKLHGNFHFILRILHVEILGSVHVFMRIIFVKVHGNYFIQHDCKEGTWKFPSTFI